MFSVLSLGVSAQAYDMAVTPDTVADGGLRKNLRRLANWNVLKNDGQDDSLGLHLGRIETLEAAVYWSKASTNISPATSGDDILLPDADRIQFRDANTHIRSGGSGYMNFQVGGTDMITMTNSWATFRGDWSPNATLTYDLGSTGSRWAQIWGGVFTGSTFNGVALSTGGAATSYLDETGNYSVPSGVPDSSAHEYETDSVKGLTGSSVYVEGLSEDVDLLKEVLADTGDISDYVVMMEDTVALTGVLLDSAKFNTSYNIVFPKHYGPNTWNITETNMICSGGTTPNFTYNVRTGADVSATGTPLHTSASAVSGATSTSTGVTDATDTEDVAAGNYMWFEFVVITTPIDDGESCTLTLIGYED